jgi:hypothetical protein
VAVSEAGMSAKINYQPGPLRLASKRPALAPPLIRLAAIIVISGLLAWAIDSQWMGGRLQEEIAGVLGGFDRLSDFGNRPYSGVSDLRR